MFYCIVFWGTGGGSFDHTYRDTPSTQNSLMYGSPKTFTSVFYPFLHNILIEKNMNIIAIRTL